MKIIKNNKKINKVKLKDLCEINLGQSPNSESYSQKESDMPFFQGAADFTEKYTKIRYYTDAPKKTAFKGDLLMTVRAPVGRVNLANVDCAIGRGVCSFRFEDESLKKYMYHYLCNLYRNNGWGGDVQGAIFEAVNKNNIEEKLIALDLDSYSKVSYFLSLFENRLMKLKKLIKKIEIRNQYYADELLDGKSYIENNKIFKNIKFTKPILIDTIINDLPKSKLDAAVGSDKGEYRFFKSSAETYWSDDFIYDVEAIVMADGGKANVEYYNGKFSTSNHVYVFNSPLLNNKYFYYLLKSKIHLIDNCFQGAALKNLSKKQFKQLELNIFEEVEYQNRIVFFLDNLNNEKEKIEKLLHLEKQRFEWLSDKLLSGEYIIED